MKNSTKVGTYRDVDVMVEGGKSLQFVAMVAAQRFVGPSWESITKKLDDAIGFAPRDVVMEERDNSGRGEWIVSTVRIVGREKSQYGPRFIKADGEPIKGNSVYEPKAAKLLEEKRRLVAALEKVRNGYSEKIDAIHEQLNPLLVRPE